MSAGGAEEFFVEVPVITEDAIAQMIPTGIRMRIRRAFMFTLDQTL